MEVAATQWKLVLPATGDEILGVTEVDPAPEAKFSEVELLNGGSFRKQTGSTFMLTFTVIDTGIDNLKKFLATNFLDAGDAVPGQPGVTVATGGKGAIALGVPVCGQATVSQPFQLVPCDNPEEHKVTVFDGEATVTAIPIDDRMMSFEIEVYSNSNGTQAVKGDVEFPVVP